MCLVTSMTKPLVAQEDIRVVKRLEAHTTNGDTIYQTPYAGMRVELDTTIDGGNRNYALDYEPKDYIEEGYIHAYIKTGIDYDTSFVAYIPKGTEYFIGDNMNTVCARKLHITSEKYSGQYDPFANVVSDYYAQLKITDGIAIGDVVYSDLTVKHIIEVEDFNSIIGLVSAVIDGKAIITALKQKDLRWREKRGTVLSKQITSYEAARKDHDGEKYTAEIEALGKDRIKDFPAFEYCINYNAGGFKWHLLSIGTLYQIFRYNLVALNMSIAILKKHNVECEYFVGCYWASAVYASTLAWYCGTNYSSVYYYDRKWYSFYVRPSLALDLNQLNVS